MTIAATSSDTQSLALLREWSSVVDSIAAGRTHVLIRKGGIAEGRDGFQLKRSFFGLLPTLFHQVKSAQPQASAPTPPSAVSILCQLVEAWSVPSTISLDRISGFHEYSADQLVTRQQYKPERPVNLIVIRPFRLRQPLHIEAGQVKTVCRSWAEVPLTGGLGGIDPVIDVETADRTIAEVRRLLADLDGIEQAVI